MKYDKKQGNAGLISSMTTVLALSGYVGGDMVVISRSKELSLTPSRRQDPRNGKGAT